jgi:6-phosphofructokinase 1
MGRHTGWIALMAGMAGSADVIMIPEFDLMVEDVCDIIKERHAGGKEYSIVVVSEGAKLKNREGAEQLVTQSGEVDQFGNVRLGGVGNALEKEIEARTGYETRVTVLGHIQRGGSPTAHDRVLATRFGIKAAEMVEAGQFGRMAAARGDQILDVPLAEGVEERKMVPKELWDLARTFF